MTFDSEKLLDRTGWRILEILQEEARISLAELGRKVGLSAPAIAERVKRMEEAGIIIGYQAQVNPEKVGYAIAAIIALTTTPQKYPQILALIEMLPEVRSCHHVTGNFSFFMEVTVSSMGHLEEIINQLSEFGQTSTSIILSSPLPRRGIMDRQ
ncbi:MULTISPECIES: Lrp/AsnC family transcriptional regulator [unclassified Roseofilum]|uniref:Lrp/AsnC family transcriptional regulator n=1 Tax=unclassified Roseofilum TaxID=2620099 RepID=UPI000E89DDA4|nr:MULTISPECIES: Lrp/AsnC family transcriptional regulator [unclassified Roseofilum]MBP0006895.1 Lrp/AsnC family transcriptional regulator [Roseofilum sp. Belize Diploria]MBP0031991.1 Lrp/AsnC family transcriptional regulator [Roseofilum sp. Belize BBD 4]MBP0043344.1 Lrp/AsnC family transcriptional regulator [Roseofilum sp. SBFL]HBR00768.1 AsnC family transcriptional regulator [Cyanobacteria bacterium UBA11691]